LLSFLEPSHVFFFPFFFFFFLILRKILQSISRVMSTDMEPRELTASDDRFYSQQLDVSIENNNVSNNKSEKKKKKKKTKKRKSRSNDAKDAALAAPFSSLGVASTLSSGPASLSPSGGSVGVLSSSASPAIASLKSTAVKQSMGVADRRLVLFDDNDSEEEEEEHAESQRFFASSESDDDDGEEESDGRPLLPDSVEEEEAPVGDDDSREPLKLSGRAVQTNLTLGFALTPNTESELYNYDDKDEAILVDDDEEARTQQEKERDAIDDDGDDDDSSRLQLNFDVETVDSFNSVQRDESAQREHAAASVGTGQPARIADLAPAITPWQQTKSDAMSAQSRDAAREKRARAKRRFNMSPSEGSEPPSSPPPQMSELSSASQIPSIHVAPSSESESGGESDESENSAAILTRHNAELRAFEAEAMVKGNGKGKGDSSQSAVDDEPARAPSPKRTGPRVLPFGDDAAKKKKKQEQEENRKEEEKRREQKKAKERKAAAEEKRRKREEERKRVQKENEDREKNRRQANRKRTRDQDFDEVEREAQEEERQPTRKRQRAAETTTTTTTATMAAIVARLPKEPVRRGAMKRPDSPLFSGLKFLLTGFADRDEQAGVELQLCATPGGGQMLDVVEDLSAIVVELRRTQLDGRFPATLVVANRPTRTVKYLMALACDVPAVHVRWVEHCVALNLLLDWRRYVLPRGETQLALVADLPSDDGAPMSDDDNDDDDGDDHRKRAGGAGYSAEFGAHRRSGAGAKRWLYAEPAGFAAAPAAIVHAPAPTAALGTQRPVHDVFEEMRIELTGSSKFVSTWKAIVRASNGRVVDRLMCQNDPKVDYVLTEGTHTEVVEAASIKHRVPIVSIEWAVQSLIHGHALPHRELLAFSGSAELEKLVDATYTQPDTTSAASSNSERK
jgi:BRCA1 C Terminus (BRCT) domain